MQKIIYSSKIQLLLIILLTTAVYFNTLQNKLVWDDHLFLENWPQITDLKFIPEILNGSAPPQQGKIFRPVRGVIYALDYKMWGADPFFYHLQALLVHLAVTILVYLITKQVISSKQNLQLTTYNLLPFTTALLFGLHPIHTETIDYISTSMETWGSLFFFASFFFYLKSNVTMKQWSNVTMKQFNNRYYYTSVALATAAFFTYEMTLTLPLLIVLYDLCFKFKSHKYLKNLKSLKIYLPYLAGVVGYLFIRFQIIGIISRTDYLAYSFYLTMLTMAKVFMRYILLMFFPLNQTVIHNLAGDFPSSMIPYDKLDPILNQTIFDPGILISIIIIISLILFAIKIYRKYPLISFTIGWFFISLLPVSYIIPHGGAMAEKYLYIASFGFILGIVTLLYCYIAPVLKKINNNLTIEQSNNFLIIVLLGISLVFGTLTFQRNKVWHDDITLFSDVVKKSPGNLLANYTLGIWFSNSNQPEAAIRHYQTAIDKAPEFWQARYNLANILLKQGNFSAAKTHYLQVKKDNPDFKSVDNILTNLARLDASTDSTQIISNEVFTKYQTRDHLTLYFPDYWSVSENQSGTVIKDPGNILSIEISPVVINTAKDNEDFIANQKKSYGTLLNQGPAKIPNFDMAYVKVWNNPASEAGQKLQFFLFSASKVVQVLVYPADSPLMKQFDAILGSIKKQ